MALCVGFLSLIVRENRYRHQELIHQVDSYIQNSLALELDSVSLRYNSRLEGFIKSNYELIDSFISRNRLDLIDQVRGRFHTLKKENPDFVSISFIDRNGIVMLRTAKPEQYGDSVLDIPLVAKVFAQRQPMYGLTVARWGLAYRLARPVITEQGFQGVIVFVIRPLSGLKLIRKSLNVDCGIFIGKQHSQHLKNVRYPAYNDYYLMEKQGELFGVLSEIPAVASIGHGLEVRQGGEDYLFFSPVELKNFEDKVIGYIQPVKHYTAQSKRYNATLQEAVVAGTALMVMTFIVLYLGIGRLLRRLDQLNNELEIRVIARTEELRVANDRLQVEVGERELVQLELQRLSRIDSLTEIANRRYFDELAGMEWRDGQREKRSLTMLMVDVDFFKIYNDCYGHPAGDDCLRRIASALQEQLKRPRDIVARYGGEEFICLLPTTERGDGGDVATAICRAISALAIEHRGSLCSDVVTVSIGAASYVPRQGDEIDSLLHRADQALYAAKQGGRNTVVVSEEN
ncbi:MAG: diguanylate cyclase [Desulfuromonas sp.]|nr:diguanylate cyclase [Desulfuromonas sp.]